MGKDDDHTAIEFEHFVRRLEGLEHSFLIGSLGSYCVATEATRIVNQLAVVSSMIPLWRKLFGEIIVKLRRETIKHSAKPNVKEVHEVGIWNSIIVRRVRNDEIIRFTTGIMRSRGSLDLGRCKATSNKAVQRDQSGKCRV